MLLLAASSASAGDMRQADPSGDAVWRDVLRVDVDSPSNHFPVLHRCFREPNAPTCDALRAIKQPNWSYPEDIIVVPHRGYWGFGAVASVPENSEPGYENVTRKDFLYSEVDFMPSADGLVMSHDYVLPRLTEAPPTDDRLIYQMPTGSITALRQRDRFGVIQPSTVLSAARTFAVFSSSFFISGGEPPVIFVDIKQKPDPKADQYARNWVATLSAILIATPYEQLYQLAIKTPYTPRYIISHLTPEARDRFLEVLWMPQVGSDAHYESNPPGMGGEPVHSSADFVQVWRIGGAVLAFETNYKTPTDSRLQPFTRSGVKYANILDYIKQVTNLRGGVFAEEPVGQRGVVDRQARWKFKDASEDQRGDFIIEAVAPLWGNFIVVTTDRPDVWQSVKREVWPARRNSN